MKKKKILIMMRSMDIGGVERSLLGLINIFDYKNYEVSLMLLHHQGQFLKDIPKEVNLLPESTSYSIYDVPIKSLIFSKRFIYGIARILSKIELSLYCMLTNTKKDAWIKQQFTHKYLKPLMPDINGKYDLAINYLGFSDILVSKVQADVKVGWVHTDYNHIVAHKKMDIDIYSKLDIIANISDGCKSAFLEHYPQFDKKAVIVENILSKELIVSLSKKFDVDVEMPIDDSLKLLSIGRFARAKNFDNIPEICKNILSSGIKVKWYIIGYGGDENLIKQKIKEFGMQDKVVILGKKENPYPYIKACDFYIHPSRFEGKAVTPREAQILNKPTIITNFKIAPCQLIDGIDGVIVPLDNKGCANGIIEFINDQKKINMIINNTKKRDYTNKEEIQKIYSFIK